MTMTVDSVLNLLESVHEAEKRIRATKLNTGYVDCPACSDKIAFAIHSNGHIHAKCRTENCIRWME